jgi:hypothetical protein
MSIMEPRPIGAKDAEKRRSPKGTWSPDRAGLLFYRNQLVYFFREFTWHARFDVCTPGGSALPLKEQPRQRFLYGPDFVRFRPALTRRVCDADLVVTRFELFKDLAALVRVVDDLGLLAVALRVARFLTDDVFARGLVG